MTISLILNIPNENLNPTKKWIHKKLKWTLISIKRLQNWKLSTKIMLTSGLSVWVATMLLFCGSSLIRLTFNKMHHMSIHTSLLHFFVFGVFLLSYEYCMNSYRSISCSISWGTVSTFFIYMSPQWIIYTMTSTCYAEIMKRRSKRWGHHKFDKN